MTPVYMKLIDKLALRNYISVLLFCVGMPHVNLRACLSCLTQLASVER